MAKKRHKKYKSSKPKSAKVGNIPHLRVKNNSHIRVGKKSTKSTAKSKPLTKYISKINAKRKQQRLKAKLRGKTYEEKVKILRKHYGEIGKAKVKQTYEKWKIVQKEDKAIKLLPKSERTKYYRREYAMYTGRYEKQRQHIWKQNYIRAMQQAGVSEEVIEEFKKVANVRNIDLLSHDLDSINTWYVQNDGIKYDKDEADTMVKNIISDIKNGRYSSSETPTFYNNRINEMEENVEAILDIYKKHTYE